MKSGMLNVATGLPEFNAHTADQLSLFPNPASQTVNMDWGKGAFTKMEIFAADGRLIRDMTIPKDSQGAEINTSAFENGIYLVRLSNSEKAVSTKKMVIAR